MVFYKLQDRILRFSRFCGINVVVFLAELALTIILVELAGMYFLTAYIVSLIIGIASMYKFHHHMTFKNETRERFRKFFRFIGIMYSLYAINVFAVWAVTTYTPIHYAAVICIVTPIFALVSYKITKRWCFLCQ